MIFRHLVFNLSVFAEIFDRESDHRFDAVGGSVKIVITKPTTRPLRAFVASLNFMTSYPGLTPWARRAWNEWIGWTKNCKLEPMIRAASMVQRHLDGIINAIVLKTTNALGESMNAKIQQIKSQPCGYRNRQRFRNAIMFHLRRAGFVPSNRINPHGFLKRPVNQSMMHNHAL